MSSASYEPVERAHHFTVQVGHNLYMWGGRQSDLPEVHSNEKKKAMCSVVEVCNLKSGRWKRKPTTSDPPLGVRSYAAAVIRNEIFFFGGWCGHDDCYHNSLFSFNIDTLNWKELSPTTSRHGPMMRVQCGMTAVRFSDEDCLAVIGGFGPCCNNTPPQPGAQYNNGRCNEVHLYKLKTGEWTSPTVTGDRPPPIDAFTLTSINNTTAILFGGSSGDKKTKDVYILEFTDTSVNCTKFSKPGRFVRWPKGRWGHSSVLINCSSGPHLLVVGGSHTKDCWLLNVSKMEWKELNIPDSVTNRYYHSLSVWNETQTTHWIIEFGGLKGDSILSNTAFIETISRDDLVVQSVLDINEYQKRRVLEGLEPDILDKKPRKDDLLRLFQSSDSHFSTIGTALGVKVDDLMHSPMSASDKLILVFQRWIDSNNDVTWRKVLQVCNDYPDQLGKAKAHVKGFLSL
ncbi:PREDICTED: kelch domain-containing protein 1-like isoform X2 [Amphimedon queenslandica]|uniref:Death domain-containing protein n=1 Tax=Amphimedon queenslandica TaxID=400682 RepID=A0AAN0JEX1_AMPQE|nr:PREDICTED: kelch domain-containing protein 1-like isoform X2 [Amphimedon queenslandica]|eukprot:XP_019855233.1 PREDICTED: kelch domain-containing protein 1-like isoform X2 [Amphimedon queenslandica]